MAFGIAEHGIAGAAEREKAHGGCDTNVDTDHARFHTILEFTRARAAAGINTGGIAKSAGVDQIDDFIQIFGANYADHRAEDFFPGDGHIGFDVVENGGSDEKSVGQFRYRKITPIQNKIGTIFDSLFNVTQGSFLMGRPGQRSHGRLFIQSAADFHGFGGGREFFYQLIGNVSNGHQH